MLNDYADVMTPKVRAVHRGNVDRRIIYVPVQHEADAADVRKEGVRCNDSAVHKSVKRMNKTAN